MRHHHLPPCQTVKETWTLAAILGRFLNISKNIRWATTADEISGPAVSIFLVLINCVLVVWSKWHEVKLALILRLARQRLLWTMGHLHLARWSKLGAQRPSGETPNS
jgi:hypothetical protein